jgi:two-component system response regulator HydG
MLGDSAPMREVRRLVAQAAPAEAAVLVTGESGTGKELVARAIHAGSPRAQGPFEVVNCAALAESLIESELFGHAKGAFTGAAAERIGRFELADGGTLFLDEIGELSAGAQAKLLRVLEQGEFSRVGESLLRRVDVRVIAATNRDLEAEVRAKRFRQDLYYRLNVLRIALPPLCERGSDVGLLLDHFLAAAARRLGKPRLELEPAARQKLLGYLWPGNVRELRNLVERLAILSAAGKIALGDLPPEVSGAASGSGAAGAAPAAAGAARKLDELVREHILAAVAAAGGNKTKAAELLGIDRSTLYARLKEYGQG